VELNTALHALTPPEYCYHLTMEQMAEPGTTVFIAREGGCAIACGALKQHAGGIGEVKRMYTKQAWQGQGIGGRIVAEVEHLARAEGLRQPVLETGNRHPAAWRMYEHAGFHRCGAVLDYPDSAGSVFYQKPLVEAVAA
jgi:putative acetyltransferase